MRLQDFTQSKQERTKSYRHEYYLAHKHDELFRAHEWRNANKDRANELSRKWKNANKDKVSEYRRKYYLEHGK